MDCALLFCEEERQHVEVRLHFWRDLPLPRRRAAMNRVAAIDIHKKVLMVVVLATEGEEQPVALEQRRFSAGHAERQHLAAWLKERGVSIVVMESTAQYWKPVWLDLEPHFAQMYLAQAHSNRAPRGRKNDFADARRLGRRWIAGELLLSFVPDAEQRQWRTIARTKNQLVRDRVRLHNQMEALLEEMRIKLSSVITDLLGVSGRRILQALAQGETDPQKLAELGHERLQCSQEELADALRGSPDRMQRAILSLDLDRLQVLDRHIHEVDQMIAQALKKHEQAVIRLAQVPGFGSDSAHQLIAEVGADAAAFPSPAAFSSWAGLCPGSNISAEHNHSARSAKGNRFVRRILNQAAHAAVKKKGSHLQAVFRRWVPRLGYKVAICAIAHRLARIVWKILHDGVTYIEMGQDSTPQGRKRRAQRLAKALRALGYDVTLIPKCPLATASAQ
jgi:transposase